MKNDNAAYERTNQWAELNDPQSSDATQIRNELVKAPSLKPNTIAEVESFARVVLRKACDCRIRSTVESVISDFIDHSDQTYDLFEEIGAFYKSHGIAEEMIEWFSVKEVMRILLSSAFGRKFEVRKRMLTRYEFEDARVYLAER